MKICRHMGHVFLPSSVHFKIHAEWKTCPQASLSRSTFSDESVQIAHTIYISAFPLLSAFSKSGVLKMEGLLLSSVEIYREKNGIENTRALVDKLVAELRKNMRPEAIPEENNQTLGDTKPPALAPKAKMKADRKKWADLLDESD